MLQGNYTVSNPEAPASHQVSQHHVSGQAITDNCNLRRVRDAGFWMLPEILHNLSAATRLFDCVAQHVEARSSLNFSRVQEIRVPATSTGRIGHYQQASARICLLQSLKVRLLRVSV